MGTVVVLGSLIVDLVSQAPRLPLPGESLIGDSFGTYLGGKGINQAISAARLGGKVTLIGRVGIDSFGDGFFPALKNEDIDSRYVTRDDQIGTGISLVVIATDSGQNAIVTNPRANLAVPASAVEEALDTVLREREQKGESAEPAIFLCQCETSQSSYDNGLRRARKLGITTILNAAPVPREALPEDLLTFVDILIVNETEAAAFSQVTVDSLDGAKEAARVLLGRGSKHVIITLGAQGCLWTTKRESDDMPLYRFLPAFSVKAVDATAAGDAFCGALAASLSCGLQLEDALRRASAAGAITASRMGAIAALPNVEQVNELIEAQPPHV